MQVVQNSFTMFFPPVRKIIRLLKLVDYFHVQADNLLYERSKLLIFADSRQYSSQLAYHHVSSFSKFKTRTSDQTIKSVF